MRGWVNWRERNKEDKLDQVIGKEKGRYNIETTSS
jgi:hypothetical protein